MGSAVIIYITFITHRALSGVRNGMGYNPKPAAPFAAHIVSAAIAVFTLLLLPILRQNGIAGFIPNDFAAMIVGAAIVCSLFAQYMALRSLVGSPGNTWERDTHFWTLAEQTFLAGAIAVTGLPGVVAMCLAVYPSVFIQKAFINRFLELGVFFDGTDDPTGKTYAIPSLGLKIPRLRQRQRLWLSLISVVIFILFLWWLR